MTMFCHYEKCNHYGNMTKHGDKCYYEPQCWRGSFDAMLVTFGTASHTVRPRRTLKPSGGKVNSFSRQITGN